MLMINATSNTMELALRLELDRLRPNYCLGIPAEWWFLDIIAKPDAFGRVARLWLAEPRPTGPDEILATVMEEFNLETTHLHLGDFVHNLLLKLERDMQQRNGTPTAIQGIPAELIRAETIRRLASAIRVSIQRADLVGSPEIHIRSSEDRFGYDLVVILHGHDEGEIRGVATGFHVDFSLIDASAMDLVRRLKEDVIRRAQVFRVSPCILEGTPALTFEQYVAFTRTTACNPGAGQCRIDNIAYLALGLASEAGEVAGKIKKSIRGDLPVPNLLPLVDEMGDVLWYLVRLCEDLGVNPAWLMQRNQVKLQARASAGTLKGSGDVR